MTRADADSWDIASSVGATATMVAAARAIAGREPDALIDDPYAEPLVRAVGMDFFNRLLDGEVGLTGDDDGATRLLTNVMAVRTRFFDDFFLEATESGIRQAVILASGLDARAYRLAVARGHRRIRDRPAQGHRVQERDDGVDRRRTDSDTTRGEYRPPRGLAGCTATQRL